MPSTLPVRIGQHMALSLHGPLAELRNADVVKWVNAAILKEDACNPLVGTPNFEEYPGVLEVRFILTAAFRWSLALLLSF